jgi:hypothetical protein
MRIVLAGAAASAALFVSAAVAGTDPKGLVLQLSDFPAGTRAGNAYGLNGPTAKQYTTSFEIRPGDIKREEDVSVELWIAKDEVTAKQLYQMNLASYTGKGPVIGPNPFKGEVTLSLPTYGDEQFADYLPKPTRPHGQLFVRKGNVTWSLTVENCTPLAFTCYGTSRTEAPIGQATALAELKKYAARQAKRLG